MSAIENRAAVNLAVVGGIYEAFGRGDIDFILDQIADDCSWESWLDDHGQKAGIPPMKPRRGREGVVEFFDYVATMQIQDFQVLDLLASDRQVVAEVQISIAMAHSDTFADEELLLCADEESLGDVSTQTHLLCRAEQPRAPDCCNRRDLASSRRRRVRPDSNARSIRQRARPIAPAALAARSLLRRCRDIG